MIHRTQNRLLASYFALCYVCISNGEQIETPTIPLEDQIK